MGTEWGEGVPCAAGCCARSVRAYSGGLRLRRMPLHIFSSLSIYPSASSVSCPPFTLLFHVCILHAGVPRPSYASVCPAGLLSSCCVGVCVRCCPRIVPKPLPFLREFPCLLVTCLEGLALVTSYHRVFPHVCFPRSRRSNQGTVLCRRVSCGRQRLLRSLLSHYSCWSYARKYRLW
jgi:hypothetical protein